MIFHYFPIGSCLGLIWFYVKFTCFKQCRQLNSDEFCWFDDHFPPFVGDLMMVFLGSFLGAIGAIKIGRTGTPRALSGPGGRNHGASQWWMASQLCAPREAKWGLVVIFGAWNKGVGYDGMMRIVFVDGFKHVSLCSTIGNHVLHDDPSNVCYFIYFQGVDTTKRWMIKWHIWMYGLEPA